MREIERKQRFVPSLEGIRGYGFLLVFIGHYLAPDELGAKPGLLLTCWTGFRAIAFVAVPAFFVLSGFLIGGILYETRNREGFFKVFYTRRILRVFPVYYLTLIGIALVDWHVKFHLDYRFWVHFLYIQNLFPFMTKRFYANPVSMIHLWSLAVEEQFYLLWPVVVWLFPERRKLIGIATALVGICFAVRFAAPLLGLTPRQVLYLTPTRGDAILLGVLLALIGHDALPEWLKGCAKWFALSGIVLLAFLAAILGDSAFSSHHRVAALITIVNFTALATLIAVLRKGSWLESFCSNRIACWIGARSYSLYLFHLTLFGLYAKELVPKLSPHFGHFIAAILSAGVILALSVVLSIASYRFIEQPALAAKERFRYGAIKQRQTQRKMREAVLVETAQ